MKSRYFLIWIMATTFLLTAGCISVKYQRIDHYLLQVKKPGRVRNQRKTIKIDRVTINQQFSGTHFIYRNSHIYYLTDYYNAFLVPPAIQAQQLIEQYLTNTHLFHNVVRGGSLDKTDYILQSNILDFYADYRDTNQPKAVIVIHFLVLHKNSIRLNKTFEVAVILKNKDTPSLVNAWNQGLNKILGDLVHKLQMVT